MLVKVLDENRVKILMEDQDIEFYGLPFEKINYDDPISRSFIYELIQKTYEQTGVNFRECRVMIEVVPGVARAYYILLTKMVQEGCARIEFDKAEKSDAEVYIFKVFRGSDVIKLFERLKRFPPETSELYCYQNQYYVLLTFLPNQSSKNDFTVFLTELEEYGGRCRYDYVNEAILKEWGELLVGVNAYDVFAPDDYER